jgi:hypothetical protein
MIRAITVGTITVWYEWSKEERLTYVPSVCITASAVSVALLDAEI